jgi:hypothetical protein
MAAIFEAPATHEAVHEAAQEWEWEHHEGAHQPESHEWEAGMESHEWEGNQEWETEFEAQEWEGAHENQEWETGLEAHEWEAGMESHEWEGAHENQEWETGLGAQEWEGNQEWETEFEAQEWESPSGEWEGSHEWETSHEWEGSPEWEADPFLGKAFKKIGRGLGRLAKRMAPFAIRALGGMIPGVGAIAGPVLGQIAQQALREGEIAANEVENEAFGGSHGEAEVGNSEIAHEAALAELLAAEAAEATSEAEAISAIAATLPLTITIMRGGSVVRPVVPVLTQGTARLARCLRKRHPQGRQLLRTVPTIQRRAVGTIVAAARNGQPVTAPLAVRSMAQATRSVLGTPQRAQIAVNRNVVLRQRTAPPSPRRALVYQPQRQAPYNPRRGMTYGQTRRYI